MDAASMQATAENLRLSTGVCALPLVRRLAAMLDCDPMALQERDPLPHGWHPLMFNTPTRQSQLCVDGRACLVDLERQVDNQLGETTARGTAVVELPTRLQAARPPGFAPARP